ncbi:proteasome assembly chaperone 4 isoform X1 [Eubalaena glacialis]|uniref:proteasome assembly chaperone 4 isoform X1 n=1 Tax=Eubalaena glacialis TaxID=27606 RepID=UPI002A5A10D2|nr:proteasome assembly chaperone 4 isoform X1 [Eubalaena glacialis]
MEGPGAAARGNVSLHNFSARLWEQLVHFHVMRLTDSLFLWVGATPHLRNLSVAMCTRYAPLLLLRQPAPLLQQLRPNLGVIFGSPLPRSTRPVSVKQQALPSADPAESSLFSPAAWAKPAGPLCHVMGFSELLLQSATDRVAENNGG